MLEYEPYKHLGCYDKTKKYLTGQNILMRMPTFTILAMFVSCFVFLGLFTYSAYNDQNYTRLAHAFAVDFCLNMLNIYIQVSPSASGGQKLLEFLPEIVRGVSIACYYAYQFGTVKEKIFIYLTLLYAFPMLYRLFNCTGYSKTKFYGVTSDDSRSPSRRSASSPLTSSC
jgi:hypothetical protein